jgi:glyoxylase-like metal-dependent hydrolase (beta-lactamase superfamily II)
MSSPQPYEIYAIRYAHHERRGSENFIGGDPHDVSMPLDYFIWVIKNDQRLFVLDTGFDLDMAEKRKRQIVRHPAEGLKAIGVDPANVEDVIISHMHYDHCGNVDMFPRARYHVQDKEMHYCTGRCMCHRQLRASYEEDYVVSMLRKIYAGRVTFHDGVSEFAPGITLHHIGGHAMGLQSIRVKTRRGFVMLAADAVHLYPHLDEARIFPTTYNLAEVLEGYQTLKRLASSRHHIVPGHDPAVMKIYPAASPQLAGLVVRLDADPKV